MNVGYEARSKTGVAAYSADSTRSSPPARSRTSHPARDETVTAKRSPSRNVTHRIKQQHRLADTDTDSRENKSTTTRAGSQTEISVRYYELPIHRRADACGQLLVAVPSVADDLSGYEASSEGGMRKTRKKKFLVPRRPRRGVKKDADKMERFDPKRSENIPSDSYSSDG